MDPEGGDVLVRFFKDSQMQIFEEKNRVRLIFLLSKVWEE